MFKAGVFDRGSRKAFITVLFLIISALAQLSTFATGSVTLTWAPSTDTNVVGYDVYYGVASRTYTNSIDVGNTTNATITGLVEGTTYYFAVTAYDSLGQESDYSNEISYTVPVTSNPPPTIVLTAPSNGASYLAPATINLAASVTTNGHSIAQIQFYNGATLLGSASVAPYSFTWNSVSAGSYTLSAQVVYDSGSNAASSSVNVTVTNPPPTIALTAPVNGANYTAPATINLAASVTANGHSITQVQFYNGATLLGSASTAPYSFTWNSVGAGSYSLTAKAVYDSGSTVTSTAANVTVGSPPPTIALTAPGNGASYLAPATINLAASVTANGHSITQVQFYNGATLLGSASTAPYSFTWNSVGAGSYTLSAQVVYDSGSTAASSAVNVTVTNPPPAIALTAPGNGATYTAPATINLAASVTANGHSITQVQFYNGATLLGSASTAPYSFTWNSVSAGSYTLSAQVVYDSGSTLSSSTSTVTVTNPPPTIALTAPANGAAYAAPATINLAANVTANGHSITQVQFYNGATLLGSANAAPYAFTWSSVGAGSYSLTAKMIYDGGSTMTSSAASVTVTNPPPAIALSAPANGAAYTALATINLVASVAPNGHSVTQVQFYNGATLLGSANAAPYAFTWTSVRAGSYTLTADVIYDAGSALASPPVNVTVTNPPPPPPPTLISVTGNGTLSPDLSQQTLIPGTTYTVTAVPGPGQEFAGWSGSITSTNPTVTFVMTSDFSLNATFVPSPYAPVSGTFSGLFYETNQDQVQTYSAGWFKVQVTARNTYSGRLQIGGTQYSISGKVDGNGHGTNALLRRASTALKLQMRLGAGNQADQIFGSLSDGTWVATLAGERAVFNALTNPAPYAGNYTIVFPGQAGNPSLPAGNGFGTVRVTSGGLVSFAGQLADGSRVSQGAVVSGHGLWPLYVSLYSGKGLLTSWLGFTNEAGDDLSGLTSWIKPAGSGGRYYGGGFTNEFQTIGSAYLKPGVSGPDALGLNTASVAFSGGDLPAGFTNFVALSLTSHVTNLSGNRLTFNFSLNNGTFIGTVADPAGGNPLPFSGAVFQKTSAGYGLLLGADQSSGVIVGPTVGGL